ncbi:MAG: carboxylesterase/lipase family protein [Acidimicrobiales bacterium]
MDVLEVAAGRIRGRRRGGVWSYRGVPYARSPEGPLRWRPPQPVVPWAGVRDATAFGPTAPQPPPIPGVAVPGDPLDQSEDCLSLNVWTPAPDGARRPVMVWIHGGGFTSGTGASILYRGADLALHGDVVVVTVNYRLGALGFLAHPALAWDGGTAGAWDGGTAGGGDGGTAATAGNWGLLDQVAALRWVREHAAAFGGDPGNVTVFGESAGAMSISALLAMPMAAGLFHRAVVQSGPPYTHTARRAEQAAEDLAAQLGIERITRAVLERVPAADLVAATKRMQDRLPPPGELPLPFLPVVDGAVLPRPPEDAAAAGLLAPVPLLVGTNRDELTFFAMGDRRLWEIDDRGLHYWMARAAPDVPAHEVVGCYREARAARGEPVAPRDLWVAAGSDRVFRWPSLALAAAQGRHHPGTYVYLFTWETPAFGGLLGSCHALEIPFVFGSVRRPVVGAFTGDGPEAEHLSARMRDAWTAFARAGDPSHPGSGSWPAWDPGRRATMVFGPGGGAVEHAPRNEELAVWERVVPLVGPAAA